MLATNVGPMAVVLMLALLFIEVANISYVALAINRGKAQEKTWPIERTERTLDEPTVASGTGLSAMEETSDRTLLEEQAPECPIIQVADYLD